MRRTLAIASFISEVNAIAFALSAFLQVSLLIVSLPSTSDDQVITSVSAFTIALSERVSAATQLATFATSSKPLVLDMLISVSVLPITCPSKDIPFLTASVLGYLIFLFSAYDYACYLSRIVFSASEPLLGSGSVNAHPSSMVSSESTFTIALYTSVTLVTSFNTHARAQVMSRLSAAQ